MLGTPRDAPAEYHDKLTVAKTFVLAIEEAAELHPAAEPFIVYAALLAPEPIPLFLFAEAREKFGEPLASALAGDGLDEAVAALRSFALIDRAPIVDERDPTISTDTIRLHRLVREVAAARRTGAARENAARALVEALAAVYPPGVFNDPRTWPQARRLDALALGLISSDAAPPASEMLGSYLSNQLAAYRYVALGAYASGRPLHERALALRVEVLGPEHPATVVSSTTSPTSVKRRAILQRHDHSTNARWGSTKSYWVLSTPIRRRALTTSPYYFGSRAISLQPCHSSSERLRSVGRCLGRAS